MGQLLAQVGAVVAVHLHWVLQAGQAEEGLLHQGRVAGPAEARHPQAPEAELEHRRPSEWTSSRRLAGHGRSWAEASWQALGVVSLLRGWPAASPYLALVVAQETAASAVHLPPVIEAPVGAQAGRHRALLRELVALVLPLE